MSVHTFGRRIRTISHTLRLDAVTDLDHIRVVPQPQIQQPSAGSPDVRRARRVQDPRGD